tara:strand:- start:189 stop:536 length:348 start_codon:yes stop_codon:yes gene_type:complete
MTEHPTSRISAKSSARSGFSVGKRYGAKRIAAGVCCLRAPEIPIGGQCCKKFESSLAQNGAAADFLGARSRRRNDRLFKKTARKPSKKLGSKWVLFTPRNFRDSLLEGNEIKNGI